MEPGPRDPNGSSTQSAYTSIILENQQQITSQSVAPPISHLSSPVPSQSNSGISGSLGQPAHGAPQYPLDTLQTPGQTSHSAASPRGFDSNGFQPAVQRIQPPVHQSMHSESLGNINKYK